MNSTKEPHRNYFENFYNLIDIKDNMNDKPLSDDECGMDLELIVSDDEGEINKSKEIEIPNEIDNDSENKREDKKGEKLSTSTKEDTCLDESKDDISNRSIASLSDILTLSNKNEEKVEGQSDAAGPTEEAEQNSTEVTPSDKEDNQLDSGTVHNEPALSPKAESEESDSLLKVCEEKTVQADEMDFIKAQEEELNKAALEEESDEADSTKMVPEQSESSSLSENVEMDIEESAVILESNSKQNNPVAQDPAIPAKAQDEESDKENKDEESDKENKEEESDKEDKVEETSKPILAPTVETAPSETSKKRPSESQMPNNDAKKVKLDEKVKLSSIAKFLMDKTLANMTREQLEFFILEKVGESIIYKSKVGELQTKLLKKQTSIDQLRADVATLSKTTKDLFLINEKLVQDLRRFKSDPSTPLLIPKITRSVGLQVVMPVDWRKVQTTQMKVQATKVPISKVGLSPIGPKKILPAPNRSPPKNMIRKPITPRTSNVNGKIAQVPPPQPIGQAKGVIDLTDEDDRRVPPTKLNGFSGTPQNSQPPNGTKLVMVPNKQTLMVKLGTNHSSAPVPLAKSHVQNFPMLKSVLNKVPPPLKPVSSPTIKTNRHPAPLPLTPIVVTSPSLKAPPPKPHLVLNKTKCGTGIILSWKMPYNLENFEEIVHYQLFVYQETRLEPSTENWSKIGDVQALALPMAVTLTQFALGNRYYFAVRAVDSHKRHGPFSDYQTILL